MLVGQPQRAQLRHSLATPACGWLPGQPLAAAFVLVNGSHSAALANPAPPPRCPCAGAALAVLLEAHPNLLTYTVSANGKQLEKGQARASVDVSERHGAKVAGVSYWREGAAFATAPVAPLKPSAL